MSSTQPRTIPIPGSATTRPPRNQRVDEQPAAAKSSADDVVLVSSAEAAATTADASMFAINAADVTSSSVESPPAPSSISSTDAADARTVHVAASVPSPVLVSGSAPTSHSQSDAASLGKSPFDKFHLFKQSMKSTVKQQQRKMTSKNGSMSATSPASLSSQGADIDIQPLHLAHGLASTSHKAHSFISHPAQAHTSSLLSRSFSHRLHNGSSHSPAVAESGTPLDSQHAMIQDADDNASDILHDIGASTVSGSDTDASGCHDQHVQRAAVGSTASDVHALPKIQTGLHNGSSAAFNSQTGSSNESSTAFKKKQVNYKTKLNLPEMPLRDQIRLSPFRKLIKYRRFPFKFVVQVILIFLVTVQAFLFSQQRETYMYRAVQTITNTFLTSNFIGLTEAQHGYYTDYFYTSSELVKHIESTVNKYYGFVNSSLDYFSYSRTPLVPQTLDGRVLEPHELQQNITEGEIKPVEMKIFYYKNLDFSDVDLTKASDKTLVEQHYWLTPQNASGPLSVLRNPKHHSAEELEVARKLLYSVVEIKLLFNLNTLYLSKLVPECTSWHIELAYDFSTRGGAAVLALKYDIALCSMPHKHPQQKDQQSSIEFVYMLLNPLAWISIFVIVISVISFFLVCKALLATRHWIEAAENDPTIYELIMNVRQARDISAEFDKDKASSPAGLQQAHHLVLNFWQKLSFVNYWHVITLVSNLCAIVSSIFIIMNSFYLYVELEFINTVMGLAVIATWSNIVQYMAHFPQFYVLIATMRVALPNIMRFILAAGLIFIGYAIAGTILFGGYARYFRTFSDSVVTLFSIANGDMVHDCFDMIYGQNTFNALLSRVYVFSFIVVFTFVVLNIFIILVEDAFYTARAGQKDAGDKAHEKKEEIYEITPTGHDGLDRHVASQQTQGATQDPGSHHTDGAEHQMLLKMSEKINKLRGTRDKASRQKLLHQLEQYLNVLKAENDD